MKSKNLEIVLALAYMNAWNWNHADNCTLADGICTCGLESVKLLILNDRSKEYFINEDKKESYRGC